MGEIFFPADTLKDLQQCLHQRESRVNILLAQLAMSGSGRRGRLDGDGLRSSLRVTGRHSKGWIVISVECGGDGQMQRGKNTVRRGRIDLFSCQRIYTTQVTEGKHDLSKFQS